MLHRSKGASMARCMALSLCGGSLLWGALLIQSAHVLHSTALQTVPVNIGPLVLGTLSIQKDIEGSSVTFAFEPGFFWYWVIWILVGLGIGLVRKIRIH